MAAERRCAVVALIALGVTGPARAGELVLKVHDMAGGVSDPPEVVLGEARFTPRDDGVPPDATAGDHVYTALAPGLSQAHGEVRVTSGARTWTGGFALTGGEAVLLVGLEANGFAAASTRDLPLAGAPPSQGMSPPTPAPHAGGAGAHPAEPSSGGVAGGLPRPMNHEGGTPTGHGGPPEGTWIGLLGLLVAGGLLGWAARARG
jgi:hypothetical protein